MGVNSKIELGRGKFRYYQGKKLPVGETWQINTITTRKCWEFYLLISGKPRLELESVCSEAKKRSRRGGAS